MGRIKETILAKKDRPAPIQRPPSMRRFKRSANESIENSRAGRNSGLTSSRRVTLRGLRRPSTSADRREQFSQEILPTVVFRFKRKKDMPVVGVVHEGGGSRNPKTSTKRLEVLTCPAGDKARIAQFEQWENEGKGKVSYQRRKTIWHRLMKQDQKTFKPTKPKR